MNQDYTQNEERIQAALLALKNNEFSSFRKAAAYFQVSRSTLSNRAKGMPTRAQAHEHEQILTKPEEGTLVRWVKRLNLTGFPISPALLRQMAQEVLENRETHASERHRISAETPTIGHEWLYRFLNRHQTLKGVYSRQLEACRHKEATPANIGAWYLAYRAQCNERNYDLQNIYNMDETGFAVGATQSTRIIVDSVQKSNWKVTAGKQEWITVLECIDAAGGALPPLIIFKAKYTNTKWIPPNTPPDWCFSTSANGWSSNSHGFEWVRKVFEPESRKKSGNQPRLLIMDGHSSHITGNFIALCIENNIDILILPPHCSHLLQPLDVGVYGPLKRYHAKEIDRYSRMGTTRFPRVEWLEIYIRIRSQALSTSNILGGWRGAGLSPFNVQKVLRSLPISTTGYPSTPQNIEGSIGLDLTLLCSSPPDSTTIQSSNSLFHSALQSGGSPGSPTQRYAQRLTRHLESQNAEITILRMENREMLELLQTRKKRMGGKRIALAGQFVYSTQEVLDVVQGHEKARGIKRQRGRPRKAPIIESDEEEDKESIDDQLGDSESEVEESVARRTRSYRIN